MRYMVSLPTFHDHANPRTVAELAREAEEAGWDGFFIWDTIQFSKDGIPLCDPWVALAAVAMATQRIKIGTMVTPLPRRRPWKLAREAVSIDHLSGGRLILSVGLGEPVREDFERFGEQTGVKARARMLDEGLEVLTGLWSGKPFSYCGEHYKLDEVVFLPAPVQQPRIPIWIGGHWPKQGPVRRAARWDGANFLAMGDDYSADTIRAMAAAIKEHRTTGEPFDLVAGGWTPGDDPESYAPAGATWWLESIDPWHFGWDGKNAYPAEAMRERIRQGPIRTA
jgi:alkanesulfonate monooxygenase SsuD/methylene tetrahydromethanopterin reductase-like flavin-dependent oxidoreductase (luciferase family)